MDTINIRITMNEWGEFDLFLTIGDQSMKIYLSWGCFSFEHFIAWLKTVDSGNKAESYSIDEEGPDKELIAEPSGGSGLITFLVIDPYADETTIFIQSVWTKTQFISAFKGGILSFFMHEFVPEDFIGYSCESEPHLGERILADPWLQNEP